MNLSGTTLGSVVPPRHVRYRTDATQEALHHFVMPERPNEPDRTTTVQASPTAKYTKILPPAEYDKLTLEEKAQYIIAMFFLLCRHADPKLRAVQNPPDDKRKTRKRLPNREPPARNK